MMFVVDCEKLSKETSDISRVSYRLVTTIDTVVEADANGCTK